MKQQSWSYNHGKPSHDSFRDIGLNGFLNNRSQKAANGKIQTKLGIEITEKKRF